MCILSEWQLNYFVVNKKMWLSLADIYAAIDHCAIIYADDLGKDCLAAYSHMCRLLEEI